MTNDATIMEDAEDLGLKAVMGSRFQDVSKEAPRTEPRTIPQSAGADSSLYTREPLARQKREGLDAEWVRLNTVSPMAKLKGCVKGVWIYGGMSLLLFWWQQTELLDPRAAVPSFILLALLAGLRIGSICRE